jgi:hypothetical protein
MDTDLWLRAVKWCRRNRVSPGEAYWWKRAVEESRND